MKRYGNNVPSKEDVEEDQQYERDQTNATLRGGCGAMFGLLPASPVETHQKRSSLNLFSLFGFGQKQSSKKEN